MFRKKLFYDMAVSIRTDPKKTVLNNSQTKATTQHLIEIYEYCSKKVFEKKIILKTTDVLKENEEYLNIFKIKEAKKRTTQEAELLGADMTSVKHYGSKVFNVICNNRKIEQDSSHSPHEPSISSTQHESSISTTQREPNESSAKIIKKEKNQKRFTLN